MSKTSKWICSILPNFCTLWKQNSQNRINMELRFPRFRLKLLQWILSDLSCPSHSVLAWVKATTSSSPDYADALASSHNDRRSVPQRPTFFSPLISNDDTARRFGKKNNHLSLYYEMPYKEISCIKEIAPEKKWLPEILLDDCITGFSRVSMKSHLVKQIQEEEISGTISDFSCWPSKTFLRWIAIILTLSILLAHSSTLSDKYLNLKVFTFVCVAHVAWYPPS